MHRPSFCIHTSIKNISLHPCWSIVDNKPSKMSLPNRPAKDTRSQPAIPTDQRNSQPIEELAANRDQHEELPADPVVVDANVDSDFSENSSSQSEEDDLVEKKAFVAPRKETFQTANQIKSLQTEVLPQQAAPLLPPKRPTTGNPTVVDPLTIHLMHGAMGEPGMPLQSHPSSAHAPSHPAPLLHDKRSVPHPPGRMSFHLHQRFGDTGPIAIRPSTQVPHRDSGPLLKRPPESMLSVPSKKARLEGDLPFVPVQPKLTANMPQAREEDDNTEDDPDSSSYVFDVFPGGRGVPSPTFGIHQRCLRSPLVQLSFTSKLTVNRNPFRSSTHPPVWVYDEVKDPEQFVQATDFIPNPVNNVGGLFDSAEGDRLGSQRSSKKQVKKKKPAVQHDRVPLAEANLTAPKDVAAAKKLMAGIHDLSAVLPRKEAMWLGENHWIFTLEQLDYSINIKSGSSAKAGHSLAESVARSTLVNGKKSPVSTTDNKKSKLMLIGTAIDTLEKTKETAQDERDTDSLELKKPLQLSPNLRTTSPRKIKAESLAEAKALGTSSTKEKLAQSGVSSRKDEMTVVEPSNRPAHSGGAPVGNGSPRKQASHQESDGDDADDQLSDAANPMTAASSIISTKVLDSTPAQSGRHSNDPLEQAWDILDKWRDRIFNFKCKKHRLVKNVDFPLSGPIGQLLPKLVRQFLESLKVTTLFQFFALKKTETSLLIGYYLDWRKHCCLEEVKGYALARHLLGIHTRLEKAVRSMPPVDDVTRKWMKTVFCTLTGSAKEFIIDELQMHDVDFFLLERTKEWSDRLVRWRERNGLPPLKGSGKVAMISGWKTSLKEAQDVEKGEGRVLTESELLHLPVGEPEPAIVETRSSNILPVKERKNKKKLLEKESKYIPQQVSYKSGKAALKSADFLTSVLRRENVKFLTSMGIKTAEELIECDKQVTSPIILELMKSRTEATGIEAQAPTCVRLIYDWTQRVKNKLEEIESDTVAALAKRRGPRGDGDTPKAAKTTRFPKLSAAAKNTKPARVREANKSFEDPIEVLSINTRAFLETLGIFDGGSFLRSKTSIISKSYIEWRETEKMAELKGYGAIATVSGWKAQVRKAASDVGLHDLAAVQPADRGKMDPPEMLAVAKKSKSTLRKKAALESSTVSPKSDPSLLFGLKQRRVYAQGPTGTRFAFELSLRNSGVIPGELAPFLTYLGQYRESATQVDATVHFSLLDSEQLPLLDVWDQWETCDENLDRLSFSSHFEGCGLLDLGSFGVINPTERNSALKQDILLFLQFKTDDVEMSSLPVNNQSEVGDGRANIFRVESSIFPRYVFYQGTALQMGQTVELRVSSRSIHSNTYEQGEDLASGVLSRIKICNELMRLTLPEIKEIQQWVVQQHSSSIGNSVENIVLKRKFHWISTTLIDHLDASEERMLEGSKNHAPLPERTVATTMSDSVLMKGIDFKEFRSSENPEELPGYLDLMKEVTDEIHASIILNMEGVSVSDPSAFCTFSSELRDLCLAATSRYVVLKSQESLQLQESFLAELCKCSTDAVAKLINNEVTPESLVLLKPNEDGQMETVLATGSDWHEPVFRPAVDVETGDAEVNTNWYIQYQILTVVHSVATCNQIKWLHTPDPVYQYVILNEKANKLLSAEKLPVLKRPPRDWSLCNYFLDKKSFGGCTPVVAIPDSLPLFLGLVWPKLRSRYGWHVDAGPTKADVSFLPPGQKNKAKRRHDMSAKVKQERQMKRAKLDAKLKEVGFGYVPKLTKRLMNHADISDSEALSNSTLTVRSVLDKFSEYVLAKTPDPESAVSKRRISTITDGFCKLFDSLLPILGDSLKDDSRHDGTVLSKSYGCEKLIQMLLVLPNILQRSGLPIRQIEDTTCMIKDLVRYLTENYHDCFEPDFRPDEEEYDHSERFPDEFLPLKLSLLEQQDGKEKGLQKTVDKGVEEDETMVRDLVLPSDLANLTGFTEMAMSQMVPCRATQADTSKKGRKYVPIGYPGMVCRHCWGANEGKYFFTSSDSLGTAGGVVFQHLLKCPKFPPKDMKKLTGLKAQQSEARKRLKHGAQAAYFNRLWKRLHSGKTIGAAGVLVREACRNSQDEQSGELEEDQSPFQSKEMEHLEFKSHVRLVEYLQNTAPWNQESELMEAVDLYYQALHQGATIYNTNAAPSHFSSEWLLAKVSPVSLHGKQKFIMGVPDR